MTEVTSRTTKVLVSTIVGVRTFSSVSSNHGSDGRCRRMNCCIGRTRSSKQFSSTVYSAARSSMSDGHSLGMSYRRSIWTSTPLRTRFYNFQPSTLTLSLQTPYLLNRRRWCHLTNALKHIVNKQTAKISTSEIAIVSMLYCYFRQRRTIGSFLATAGPLVIVCLLYTSPSPRD